MSVNLVPTQSPREFSTALGLTSVGRKLLIVACLSGGLGLLWGCQDVPVSSIGNDNSTASPNVDTNPSNSDNSAGTGDPSVGDVTIPGGSSPEPDGGGSAPDLDTVRARIRNESPVRADVTLRFIQDENVVHLAFVRVLPETVTTVGSPSMANVVEIFGVDSQGRALPSATRTFGLDFDTLRPAEYLVQASPTPTDPGPVDEPPDRPVPPEAAPPVIVLTQPSRDVDVTLGSTFQVAWTDDGGAPGTVIQIVLRSQEALGEEVTISPAIGAALDGLNDEFEAILQGVSPGDYQVVARMIDGDRTDESVAPGIVVAKADPDNAGPSLVIRVPTANVELRNGGILEVAWDDEDEDDNATITFELQSADPFGAPLGRFPISPVLAEDPDGAAQDKADLVIRGLLPGRYDLVGTIDDGRLRGTARLVGGVGILPDPLNDPPTLLLSAPAMEVNVEVGGSLTVQWEDSDTNNDARISLFLDPGPTFTTQEGNEILLVNALSEDVDGQGDRITLGIPEIAATGSYRVLGVISDGLTQVAVWSPGMVFVTAPEPSGNPGPGQQIRRFSISEPSEDVFARLGATFPVEIQTVNIPGNAPVRLFLRNLGDNGEYRRIDVTPPGASLGAPIDVRLPLSAGVIPNKWWPRNFVLEAETTVAGIRYLAVAQGEIWIHQDVAIQATRMVNYWCEDKTRSTEESSPFLGLEIEWYGGGFSDGIGIITSGHESTDDGIVRFWVSGDGIVPENDTGDRTHRMIAETLSSPNRPVKTRVDYVTLIGLVPIGSDEPPIQYAPSVDSGEYRVIGSLETTRFGRVDVDSGLESIEVCFPLPVSP